METVDKDRLQKMKKDISEKKKELSSNIVSGKSSVEKAAIVGAYNAGIPSAAIKTAALCRQNLTVGIVGSDKAIVDHYSNYNSVEKQSDAMVGQVIIGAANKNKVVSNMKEQYADEKAKIKARDKATRFESAESMLDGIDDTGASFDGDGMTADYLNI